MTRTTSSNGNLSACPGLPVQRLHGGEPILAPTQHWWESGVTFNTATVFLPRSTTHDPLIARLLGEAALDDPLLRDGVVAAHYRARPQCDPGYRCTRSFTGLALFTPDTSRLLTRYSEPVIIPDADPAACDHYGVEDPRITEIDGVFYAVYCGVSQGARRNCLKANVCLARSQDLLQWEKLGALRGDFNACSNKDGVLFPENINGQYLLLHRPMRGCMSEWAMHLAVSDALTGVWHDCGAVLRADPHPQCRTSWVGAGAVPIPLGDQRYLVIFHTGHFLRDGRKEYDLDAAIFNFSDFDPAHPDTALEARINRIMVPETDCEVNGPYPDSVANVLFTCGSYTHGEHLYILYGGGDTFVMSARLHTQTLLNALDAAPVWERELVSV